MTAQIVEWIPIEKIPDEYQDGREVILWDGILFIAIWRSEKSMGNWTGQFREGWWDGFDLRDPTHFVPMLLPPE